MCYGAFAALGKLSLNIDHYASKGSEIRAYTDKRTDERYQTYHLPCFAVDNNEAKAEKYNVMLAKFFSKHKTIMNSTICS